MAERKNPPFESFSFMMLQNGVGRSILRIAIQDDGAYQLHVEQGSAANPRVKFTRALSLDRAQAFKDALDSAGVFGWEGPCAGEESLDGLLKWSVTTVFLRDVFTVAAKGETSAPAGFGALLEELYRLDFPRPRSSERAQAPAGSVDFSALADLFPGGVPDLSSEEMQEALSQLMRDPAGAQARMREEFRTLPAADQDRMLDALAATGMASRAWWERFLRG